MSCRLFQVNHILDSQKFKSIFNSRWGIKFYPQTDISNLEVLHVKNIFNKKTRTAKVKFRVLSHIECITSIDNTLPYFRNKL